MKVSIIVPVWNQEELVIRALDSIPRRDDIEVVVVDDASTDNTLKNVLEYVDAHPDMHIRVFQNTENKGLGYTKNVGYDNALGEYVHQLDSDDYLYTEEYSRAIDMIDGEDMVFINLVVNSGAVFTLEWNSKHGYCGGTTKFVKRSFLGDLRCPEVRAAEDYPLNEALLAKPHTEKFTYINAYHYNYPREGSLYDLLKKGLI